MWGSDASRLQLFKLDYNDLCTTNTATTTIGVLELTCWQDDVPSLLRLERSEQVGQQAQRWLRG